MEHRTIFTAAIGAGFTGFTLASASYYSTIRDAGSGIIGSAGDWWPLMPVVGLVGGVIIGSVSGLFIAGFKLRPLTAILFSGFLNLLIVGIFFFLTNGLVSEGIKNTLYALIPIGFINGLVVSFFVIHRNSLQ